MVYRALRITMRKIITIICLRSDIYWREILSRAIFVLIQHLYFRSSFLFGWKFMNPAGFVLSGKSHLSSKLVYLYSCPPPIPHNKPKNTKTCWLLTPIICGFDIFLPQIGYKVLMLSRLKNSMKCLLT